jgi:hypothetical protein
MTPSNWKRFALVEAAGIVALILCALWWHQRTRSVTRIETLRALYEFLKPAPDDGKIRTPIVIDLSWENGGLLRHVNAQRMDAAGLSRFAAHAASASPLDPIIVRSASGLPVDKVTETLRLLAANGTKIFILPFERETLALTDRNITPEGQLPDLDPVPDPLLK